MYCTVQYKVLCCAAALVAASSLNAFRSELIVKYFKVRVKVKFTLEQATKAQKGSRGIALLFP
jgi:hypothetical protein